MSQETPPRPSRTDASATLATELIAAAAEVDRTLLAWSRSLTLRERLRAATRARRALSGFRRVTPERG